MSAEKVLVCYSIVSPLHFANCLAYFCSNNGVYKNVIIFVDQYWTKNIIPNRYIEYCENNNIKLYVNESKKDEILKKLDNVDYVFVNNLAYKVVLRDFYKIGKIVIIDEGLSAYSSYSAIKRAVKREKSQGFSVVKYYSKKISKNILLVFFHKKIQSFPIFFSRTLKLNEMYKKGLLEFFNRLSEKEILVNKKNVALYCAQPWVELKEMSQEKYLTYLKNIEKKFNGMGCELIIKKHPVEYMFDYVGNGFKVLDFDGMIEEYVYINKVDCIISTNSTSSLLIPALFNIKSYIVNMEKNHDLGGKIMKLFQKYCLDFKN